MEETLLQILCLILTSWAIYPCGMLEKQMHRNDPWLRWVTQLVHTYKTKDGVAHLSFNVQWLVVLGVADVSNVTVDGDGE
jgi:hypothetical protein